MVTISAEAYQANHGTLAGAAAHDPVYAKMMDD
jgi:hypothetical protein